MAFADHSTYFTSGDSSIIGCFDEKEFGDIFEFSKNNDSMLEGWDFPHKIWVTTPIKNIDQGFRYGTVKKTVAYIAVDEDENGPVVTKWYIKQNSRREYERRA